MEFSESDIHIIQTALARTINLDLGLLTRLIEAKEDYFFIMELTIERLMLLCKLETKYGQTQRYLLNAREVYNNLICKRNDEVMKAGDAFDKAYDAAHGKES